MSRRANKKSKPVVAKMKTPRSKSVYLVRRILITNFLTLVILGLTYLWVIYLLSNANSFWDIFRGKQAYVDTDTIPPVTPYLNPIPEATKDDLISISGQSEEGVKVMLFINGSKSQETIADGDGHFDFTGIATSELAQNLYIIAIDESGNESKPSTSYEFVKDITPPEFEITNPKANEVFRSTGRTYTVVGKTEPGITITINEQFALVQPSGDFSANIRLDEGNNKLKIKATDKAGNEKEEELTMKYEKID